jgi:acetyl-CoA carboxylase carboxyltransferase component
MNYQFSPVEHRQIAPVKELLKDLKVYHFSLDGNDFCRRQADGFYTLLAVSENGKKIGVIYNDFKVNGGSFGKDVSAKMIAFVRYLKEHSIPLVFFVNSMGVRLMEGRTVFANAFSLIPVLQEFKKNNLLIAANIGRCLGLGALVFGMAHYRLSLRKKAVVNLTGPEVVKMFYGTSYDYETKASAELFFKETDIIHDLSNSSAEIQLKARHLALFSQLGDDHKTIEQAQYPQNFSPEGSPDQKLVQIIKLISNECLEVFPQLGRTLRVFIVKRNNKLMGVFINPPGNPNNMMTAESLKKFDVGLDLFHALKLPILSLIDTPGAHPVGERSRGEDVLTAIVRVTGKIIEYPFGKLGCIIGRSYGGASVLTFPEIFSSHACLAIKGCSVGIMDKSIISRLLSNSDVFNQQWQSSSLSETENLQDLISAKVITKLVDWNELLAEVDNFLIHGNELREIARELQEYVQKELPRIEKKPLETSINVS